MEGVMILCVLSLTAYYIFMRVTKRFSDKPFLDVKYHREKELLRIEHYMQSMFRTDPTLRLFHFFQNHMHDCSMPELDMQGCFIVPGSADDRNKRPPRPGPLLPGSYEPADFWKYLHHEYLRTNEDFGKMLDRAVYEDCVLDSSGWTKEAIQAVKDSHEEWIAKSPLTVADRNRFMDRKMPQKLVPCTEVTRHSDPNDEIFAELNKAMKVQERKKYQETNRKRRGYRAGPEE